MRPQKLGRFNNLHLVMQTAGQSAKGASVFDPHSHFNSKWSQIC